jgi:hypothetical protein
VPEGQATPAEQAALDMVRHAPRRIILPPGQPQAVRISARPPAELADGEYRVHLTFRAIPSTTTPEQDVQAQTEGGLSIRLTPIYGVSIPVFVRKGRLEATASLGNPHVTTEGPDSYLDLDLNRIGGRSLYGEVVVKSARGEVLFMTRGVAIYSEIAHRSGHFRLTAEQATTMHGPVRIEYREMPENGGKLLAELAATLN